MNYSTRDNQLGFFNLNSCIFKADKKNTTKHQNIFSAIYLLVHRQIKSAYTVIELFERQNIFNKYNTKMKYETEFIEPILRDEKQDKQCNIIFFTGASVTQNYNLFLK